MIGGQIQEQGYDEAIQNLTALPSTLIVAAGSALRTALTETSSRDYLQNADAQSLASVTVRMRDNASVRVVQDGNAIAVQVDSSDEASISSHSGLSDAKRLRGFIRPIERVNSIEDIVNPSATRQTAGAAQGRGMTTPLATVVDYAYRSFPDAILEKIQPLVLAALETSTTAN